MTLTEALARIADLERDRDSYQQSYVKALDVITAREREVAESKDAGLRVLAEVARLMMKGVKK